MDYSNISFESFYQGGDNIFNPDTPFYDTGYNKQLPQLGFPGSPQTANQLGETINALKQGVKSFEVTALLPDTAETIPKQHFQEMRALMKLSGVKPSMHGPLIDAAGFGERGWEGDQGRANNENRMFEALKNAYALGPEGNIPVVFHAANGVPGAEWMPGNKELGEDRFIKNKGAMINRETGQIQATSREYKFRPGAPGLLRKGMTEGAPPGILFSAEDSIDSANSTDWEKKLLEISEMNKRTEEVFNPARPDLQEYKEAYLDKNSGKIFKITGEGKQEELPGMIVENQRESYEKFRRASLFAKDAELSFGSAFHHAWQYGSNKQKDELEKLSNDYAKKMSMLELGKDEEYVKIWGAVDRQKILSDAITKLSEITNKNNGGAPELYQDVSEFAIEKAATTFGNLAMRSYDKLGKDKSPMLAIEPHIFGAGLSKTEEITELIDKSRESFKEQLMKEKGFNEKEAKKIAETKIGATWDVGHINIMKKYGFEDKDILESTKKISPYVKHVHLTDNFGHADTHLAPGMGNAPIKEVLEELEKTGRLNEMRKIVESGAFVQHFKGSPFPLSLSAFGSPIYSMKAGPTFGIAAATQGSYFGGYGTLNPQQHHSMYGSGFTTMPTELGGQMPGGASRFGGTPMA